MRILHCWSWPPVTFISAYYFFRLQSHPDVFNALVIKVAFNQNLIEVKLAARIPLDFRPEYDFEDW